MASDHWHLVVGTEYSVPFADLIIDDDGEAVVAFLDFCQNFFYHDFDVNRVDVESKMTKHIATQEKTAFQMTGGNYVAIIYPCVECKRESLN